MRTGCHAAPRVDRPAGLGRGTPSLDRRVAPLGEASPARTVSSVHRLGSAAGGRQAVRTSRSRGPELVLGSSARAASRGSLRTQSRAQIEPDEELAVAVFDPVTALFVERDGRLVSVVEVISPRNKDRPVSRNSYMAQSPFQGISETLARISPGRGSGHLGIPGNGSILLRGEMTSTTETSRPSRSTNNAVTGSKNSNRELLQLELHPWTGS